MSAVEWKNFPESAPKQSFLRRSSNGARDPEVVSALSCSPTLRLHNDQSVSQIQLGLA
jgi:hypothetical protein